MLPSKLGIALCGALSLLALPAAATVQAEPEKPVAAPSPQQLTLREALDLALRSDPAIAAAEASRDRNHLAVLRAQLDRFSLRVDSFLTEQWRAQNLGGTGFTA